VPVESRSLKGLDSLGWALTQRAYPLLDGPAPDVSDTMERSLGLRIHSILAKCGELRPSVDIFVE